MKTFPTVVLGIFVALAVGAVLIFATYSGSLDGNAGSVSIWGTVPSSAVNSMLDQMQIEDPNLFTSATYSEFPEDKLVPELVQAIASGRAPDLVFFPAEELMSEDDKLLTIPYSSLSKRDFQDTFIEAGEVFLYPDGIKAIPFLIDPLVMYWNRSMFATAGIPRPYRYWDELSENARKLTKAEQNGSLTQSAVAMGTWDNVTHAKGIVVSLMHQLGNPVVSRTDSGFQSVVDEGSEGGITAAESVLRYYTEFADPVKPSFSWNRSQPQSRDAFISGRLAIYFGRASELQGIRDANPNLNFDVASLPEARGGKAGAEARLIGLAIPRGAPNPNGALIVARIFYGKANQTYIARTLVLPSVRRDLLGTNPANAYEQVFQQSALTAFTFIDPEPTKSDEAFASTIQNVLSGRSAPAIAMQDLDEELYIIINEVE